MKLKLKNKSKVIILVLILSIFISSLVYSIGEIKPNVDLVDYQISNLDNWEVEDVKINITLENSGNETEIVRIPFKVNNVSVESRNIALRGNEVTEISFERKFESGDYVLSIADYNIDELSLNEGEDPFTGLLIGGTGTLVSLFVLVLLIIGMVIYLKNNEK